MVAKPMPAEAALLEVFAGLTGPPGPERFPALARHLAAALKVHFAFVAEFADAHETRVLGSLSPEGRQFPSLTARPGTVIARVIERGRVHHASGLCGRYPADTSLAELGAESFSGKVLLGSTGLPAGLIGVMDTGPLDWSPVADAILGICATQAELEIRSAYAEKKLSRVARQWTATMDAMPEFVAVIGPDHRLLRVNRALARFAAVHPKELIGRQCHQVLHGLDHPWPTCPHAEALREGKSVSREIVDPHVGVPLLVTCTPLVDDSGTLPGAVHVARDISEQKQTALVRETLIGDLQEALAKLKLLSGLLPICSICKRIRNDRGCWEQVEVYVRDHSEADFTHSFCPECRSTFYPPVSS
jgi:PAS domain S-box-containing protein